MVSKIEAIIAINPDAEVSINADDYDQIIWGNTPVISLADIKDKQAELETVKADEKTKKEVDAKAGNDKLIELGLKQDQVTAMTGYVPPTEEE